MKVDQAEVLERAKSAIARNPHLINKKIRLAVSDDSIRAFGAVSTFFEKQMAQETLRPIVAPLRIENDLEVTSWSSATVPAELEACAT